MTGSGVCRSLKFLPDARLNHGGNVGFGAWVQKLSTHPAEHCKCYENKTTLRVKRAAKVARGIRPAREGRMTSIKCAVESCLRLNMGEEGIHAALTMLCHELPVDRISLHALNETRDAFRVLGSGGAVLLAPGTECGVESSTQIAIPAAGEFLRRRRFADGPFHAALDNLVVDMGYRSGVSIPLFMGSKPVGVIVASAFQSDLSCDPIIEVLTEVSCSMAMVCRAAAIGVPRRAFVFQSNSLIAEGIARVVERTLGADVATFDTLKITEDRSIHGLHCDIVICDAFMEGRRVDQFLPALRAAGATGPALVVATRDSHLARAGAARSGAMGYIPSSIGLNAIAQAVLDLTVGAPVEAVRRRHIATEEQTEVARLTTQEFRVLTCLERGLRFKEIASELRITEATAKGYARNLFAKLGVHSRSEAVHEARLQGLFELLTGRFA
jgi:DNA-binding NarL/FixJ family response regulator